jgi:hypothetical protein
MLLIRFQEGESDVRGVVVRFLPIQPASEGDGRRGAERHRCEQ